MNRLQYRIVFNKQRGQMMAVAETVRSQTKAAGQTESPAQCDLAMADVVEPAFCGPPSLMALSVAFALGAVLTLVPPAQAQVKPDTTAPRRQQPTILTAPNGTTLVNIQTPSEAGVSRNSYSQFDVNGQGVILNNSRTDVSTQLGGWVQGNPWMAKGEARVILNEVNSSAPSQLKGFVEVAGRRAEVIIANPAGIQVDGGGFINASSATLTTGTPRFDAAGNVSGFAVQGGLIRIDGAGLDASSTDYTALLARAVELNAGFWAKEARIQTGTQVMSAETAGAGQGAGEALAAIGERPRYALDSTALGGIYAQRITLVGTEAGLGVRQAGQMVGGQLTLRADGWLENSGTVYAQQADISGAAAADRAAGQAPLVVTSAQGVRNAGWMASQGDAVISAPQLQSTSGSVTAAGMNGDGTIAGSAGAGAGAGASPSASASAAALTLTASSSQQHAGQLLAPTRLDIQAPTVDLSGAAAKATTIAITGDQIAARGATLLAADALSVTGGAGADLSKAQVQANSAQMTAGSIHADGAVMSVTHALQVQASGQLSATQASLMADGLVLSAQQADLSGGEFLQTGAQAMTVRVTGALAADGSRLATNATDLLLTTGSLTARQASFEHYGSGSLKLTTGALDLGGAQVASAGHFAISAGQVSLDRAQVVAQSVDWQTGQLSHQGAVTQIAGMDASRIVSQSALDNRLGRIESNSGQLIVLGATVDNRGGVLSSIGNLHVDAGSLNNQAGVLLSNQRLQVGAGQRPALLDNTGGQIGAADVTVAAERVQNAGGLVSASGGAVVEVGQWQHGDGRLEASAVTVNTSRWEGGGTLYARGSANLTAGSLQNSGVLAAGGALTVRADQLSTSGLIAAGLRSDGTLMPAIPAATGAATGATTATAASAADGVLTLQVAQLTNSGALQSSGNADLLATGQFRNTGVVYAQGAAAVRADQLINPGTMASQGDLSVTGTQVSGSGGFAAGLHRDNTLAAQGNLTITAAQQLQFSGAMTAVGELSATGAALQLQGAQLQSRTVHLRAGAGDLSLEGATVAAQGLTLSAQQDLITFRALVSAANVQLSARDWINTAGRLTQTASDGSLISALSRDLNNQGGTIESAGRQLAISAGNVNNTAGRLAQAGGDLSLQAATWQGTQGQVLALGALDWSVSGGLALTGGTTQADSLQIRAGSLSHDGAQMVSGHAAQINLTGSLSNQGGTLAAGTTLSVEAGSVSNSASGLMQAGSVLQIGTTGPQGLDNQGGRLRSGSDLHIDTAVLNNRSGTIGSDGVLTVQTAGALQNGQGSVLAKQALTLTSGALSNQQGRIASSTGAVVVTTSGLLDNTQGSLLATSALTVNSSGLINERGELSGTAVALDARGQSFNNRAGKVLSSEAMTVRSGALDNFGGLLQSAQSLSVNTAGAALANTVDVGISTPTGLRSQGAMQIDAGTVDNGAGIAGSSVTLNATALTNRQTVSGQTLALNLSGTLDNQSGQLVGLQSTTATANQVLNQAGLIYGGQTLQVRTAGLLDNRNTSGASQGLQGDALTLEASTLDNRSGQVRANADLRVTATQSLDNSTGVLSSLGQTVLGDGGANPRASALSLTNGGGTVWGGTGVAVSAATLFGGGTLSSGGSLSLTLGGDLTYGTGTLLQARGDIGLTLGGNFVNEGTLRAGGALDITARSIDNRVSGELSGADTRLTATDTLTNRGLIDGDRVRVNAGSLVNVGTGRIYGSDLALTGGQLTNGAENGQAAVIASRGDLSIDMTGTVSNSAQALIFADGNLSLRAASVVNDNATIEATRTLQMDVSGSIVNRSVYDGANALPQDPNAPRVLASKSFISSGGDMRLTTGQLINSGATVEARGNLLLQSGDIQNLNPYLQWQKVTGTTTTGWEFQAPGSTVRYAPEQIRVLWKVSFDGDVWSSPWGSDAQGSLEPFVYEFHPKTSNWSQDTYNRKMLLPSSRYPNEIFGRYLGGLGGDVDGSADRSFVWRLSADHTATSCDFDGNCSEVPAPGAHYPASDRVWSDFGVTPGDDAALDAAMAAFFADANSRLVGDFTAFSYSRTTEGAKVTQSAAGQIIVGGGLSVQGGRIVNDMSRIIGRDGVDIQSTSIDNRTRDVAVSGTEHVDVYRTYNGGSSVPNTQYEYTTTDAAINGTVRLTLPVLGVDGAVSGIAPDGRQQAGIVVGTGGAQAQSVTTAGALQAGDKAGPSALGGLLRETVERGEDARAQRATAVVRTASGGLTTPLRSAASVKGFDASGRLRAVPVSLTLPTSSLFKLRTDTSTGYLIETDPRYASYRNWLSSDYLLQALAVDPATVQKRLGDGFYEQRLVREQIGQLTGSTFLAGYSSDETMYRALLTNGASFAQAHQLRPGVALTAEQMSQLTTDLVWLVEESVTLADGSTQRVLVPQVYLMPRDGDLQASGALIAGSRVDLALTGTLESSGDIRAADAVRATAQNIVNTGSMRGAQLALSASEDLRNIGGELTATDMLSLKAGRDLVVSSTTASSTTATSQRTVLDRVASLTAGGVMVLQAGQDVTLQAVQLKQGAEGLAGKGAGMASPIASGALSGTGSGELSGADGGILIQAGRDLKLETVQTAASDKATFNAKNFVNTSSSQDVGTNIQAQGSVTLRAGQDLTAKAAQVTSEQEAVTLSAGRDVALLAGESKVGLEERSERTKKGVFKTTTTAQYAKVDDTTAIGTTLSGDTSTVLSGRDIRAEGATIRAEGEVVLAAKRDLLLEQATQSHTSSQYSQTVKQASGLGKSLGTGLMLTGFPGDALLASVLLTGQSGSNTATQTLHEAVGTTVSAGRLTASSGRDVTLHGATMVADQDVSISAGRNLTLGTSEGKETAGSASSSKKTGFIGSWWQPAVGTVKSSTTGTQQSRTQTGSQVASLGGDVTLRAGDTYTQTGSNVVAQANKSGLGGNVDIEAKKVVIDAAQDTADSTQTSKFSKTALGGTVNVPVVSSAQSAWNSVQAGKKTEDSRMQALAGLNAALAGMDAVAAGKDLIDGGRAGIKVGVSLGTSKSQSTSSEQSTSVVGSQVNAQGDVSIRASGDGQGSTLQVVGSDIKAGGQTTLKADGAIDLEAARNSQTLHSTNSSSGASIGISYAMGGTQNGFTVELAANVSKGNADGHGNNAVQTHVSGSTVRLESGGDTTLKGAVVQGGQVSGSIGGNLNIESLQDSAAYSAKQQSASVGVSLCIPPFCYGASSASGSFSNAQAKGTYASVTEQSGIAAGDAGFQVNVKGNTDLKGGAITSSQAAIDAGKNTFSTGTLTTSDLNNQSQYSASGVTVSASTSGGQGGASSDRGDERSVTRSTISAGIANITSDDAASVGALKQLDRGAASEVTTGKLEQGWNGQKLMDQATVNAQIVAEFGAQAAKQVARLADDKVKLILNQAYAASLAGDKDLAMQLRSEAMRWEEGGMYRVGLHGALGGVSLGLSGALANVASQELVPIIAEKIRDTELPLAAKQVLVAAAGTAIGMTTGGVEGASSAYGATINNFLSERLRLQRNNAIELLKKDKDQYWFEKPVPGVDDAAATLLAIKTIDQRSDLLLKAFRDPETRVQMSASQVAELSIYVGEYARNYGSEAANYLVKYGSSGYLEPDSLATMTLRAKSIMRLESRQEAQAEVGTPALTVMSGWVGMLARTVQAVQSGAQIRDGVLKMERGEAGAFDIGMGLLGLASVTAAHFSLPSDPIKSISLDGLPTGYVGMVRITTGELLVRAPDGTLSPYRPTASQGLGASLYNSEVGIKWGGGILEQGMPWEKSVAGRMPPGTINLNEIKTNFETFDQLKPDGTAVSDKTLNTNAQGYASNPANITAKINTYVDEMLAFKGESSKGFTLSKDSIKGYEMQLAIPSTVTPDQWLAVQLAVERAAAKGVKIVVTKVQ